MSPLSYCQFMVDLEQSRTRTPNTWSITFTFSLIVTSHLKKIKHRTEKPLTQLSYYLFEKNYYFCQKYWFLCKKLLTKTKLKRSRYERVYFLKMHICVYIRTKLQVSSIILQSFRQREGVILSTPPPHSLPRKNKPLENPPRLWLGLFILMPNFLALFFTTSESQLRLKEGGIPSPILYIMTKGTLFYLITMTLKIVAIIQ